MNNGEICKILAIFCFLFGNIYNNIVIILYPKNMPYELPPLPYALDALEPYLSRETLEYHYGKHHRAYVDNLNHLIPETGFAGMSLKEIVKNAPPGPIFNNAAQIWNHTFYWESLTPNKNTLKGTNIEELLLEKWETFEAFKKAFNDVALKTFGS